MLGSIRSSLGCALRDVQSADLAGGQLGSLHASSHAVSCVSQNSESVVKDKCFHEGEICSL